MFYKQNIKIALFHIIFSIFLFAQYFLYINYNGESYTYYTPFVASSNITDNIFTTIYSSISEISFQLFGLFAYIITFSIFIRGILLLFNNNNKKYQFIFILIYIITGTIILNILSTYPAIKNILTINGFDYYAGGCIGYALSKIVFIDILKQNALHGWQVLILFVILLWSIQYVCLFTYNFRIKKLFTNFGTKSKSINKTKLNSKLNNNTKLLINNKKNNKNFKSLFNIKNVSSKSIQKSKRTKLDNQKKQYKDNNYNCINNNEYVDNVKACNSEEYYPNSSNLNNTDQYNNENYINQYNNIEHNLFNDSNTEEPNYSYEQNSSNYYENNQYEDDQCYNDSQELYYNTGEYVLPSISLLDKPQVSPNEINANKLQQEKDELLKVLAEFSVHGELLNVTRGPVVTMFEFKPAPGTKNSRVISLSDDIARSMKAATARISAIPGRNALGIELPNQQRQTIYLSELINQKEFSDNTQCISLILGKNINGDVVLSDLTKMPHVLIAGTTGSGKSVAINCMILSILFKFKPDDCKLIMIDPKMLELSVYDDIPHLLTPVVTDPKKAVFVLQWTVSEMENRYKQMSKLGVRNIENFNRKIKDAKDKNQVLERRIQIGFNPKTGTPIFENQQFNFDPMPYIVVVVDEVADLMLVAGKEVEVAIQRLTQMARAAGIHLIIATQRPSVDVITGTIKANFPTRISFQVTSKIDSRTILGEQGAEQLLGRGDMLYMSGAGRILRVHGPFVSDMEVDRVVGFIRSQGVPNYEDVITKQFNKVNNSENIKSDNIDNINNSSNDNLYSQALEIIKEDRKCSVTYIQRKLQIGYNKAARLIEEMEANGVVSPPNKNGKRDILI